MTEQNRSYDPSSRECHWYERCKKMFGPTPTSICKEGLCDKCEEYHRLERYNTPSHRFFNYINLGRKMFYNEEEKV